MVGAAGFLMGLRWGGDKLVTQKHVVEKKLVAAELSFAAVRVSASASGLDQERSDSLLNGTQKSCRGCSCFPRALGSVVAFILVVVHRTEIPRIYPGPARCKRRA